MDPNQRGPTYGSYGSGTARLVVILPEWPGEGATVAPQERAEGGQEHAGCKKTPAIK
jgi:hypothetical protein